MVSVQLGPLFELLAGIFIIVIAASIAAVLFKFSCALFNLLAGGSTPSLGSLDGDVAGDESATAINGKGEAALASDDDWADEAIPLPPRGVPKPSMEWAFCIVLFAALINAVTSFIVVRLLRLAGQIVGAGPLGSPMFHVYFFPFGFLVQSGIIMIMLPTSFGRGLLVALLFALLGISFAAIIGIIYVAIVLIFGLNGLGIS